METCLVKGIFNMFESPKEDYSAAIVNEWELILFLMTIDYLVKLVIISAHRKYQSYASDAVFMVKSYDH